MNYAQIILPLNLKGTFTYKVPEELCDRAEVGMRVLIPFGGKKIYTGIVLELHNREPEVFVPKEIISFLDEKPILPSEQIQFWQWLSEYYMCHIGEIYRFTFPASLKLESETYVKLKSGIQVDFEILDVNETYLIQALEVRQLINLSDIEAFIPKKQIIKTINALIDLQYIEIDEKVLESYKSKEISCIKIPEHLLENESLTSVLNVLNRASKQKNLFLQILEWQIQSPENVIKKSSLFENGEYGSSHLKGLKERGFVEEFVQKVQRIEDYEGNIETIETLSPEQNSALNEINEAFKEQKNVLLHGVTGSGKTHIYLQKIDEAVERGENVLFLTPETSLTKQITLRLQKKYGNKTGFYHQKLTDFEKVEIWQKIKNNQLSIVIGTRNALFLPFQNLGLIVVDEEHDSAYKAREVSPFFNAKDSAVMLAHFYKANAILGSATPSVESYFSAQKDKIRYVELSERFGNTALPKYEIIDIKEAQNAKLMNGNFSNELLNNVLQNLEQKKQTIVLHNRRGYANVVECETCGNVNYCSNCDVVMTYHKSSNELKCHYCGQRASKPVQCPKCFSTNMNERGVGVEQIQEELVKLFPDAVIDRMDVDSMRKKFAYEKLYEKLESGETDILVGTQMISKGLDFENIEVVAIPRADSMLYVQDFRAEERAYQLITQVAGRAGRISGNGKVLIQTYNPSHSVFEKIMEKEAEKVYHYFLEERKKFHYPPFTKLILIELKHRREDKADRASQYLGSVLGKYLPAECIFGPEKAPIPRLNNMYQFQILLKLPRSKKYSHYKDLIRQSLEEFDEISAYKSIVKRIFVDF